MRVLHVATNHPWTDNRVHYRECTSLACAGYDVTLIAATADHAVPGPSPVKLVIVPRHRLRWRMLIAPGRAVLESVKRHAHIVHLHDPELVFAIPVLRILGMKVIFDAHEDYRVSFLSWLHQPWHRRAILSVLGRVIVFLGGLATHVIAATETIAVRYPTRRVSILHNYPPLSRLAESSTPIHQRSKTVIYIGGFSDARGIHQMIDATHHALWPSDWTLVVAGPGSGNLRTELSNTISHPRVRYLGLLPPQEARALLDDARVGLCVFQDTAAHRDALPTKVFEYLEAGLPVIVSNFPLWRTLFNQCGTFVNQESSMEIARAVAAYDQDARLLETHATKAHHLAITQFNWEHEVTCLLDVYQMIARKHQPHQHPHHPLGKANLASESSSPGN